MIDLRMPRASALGGLALVLVAAGCGGGGGTSFAGAIDTAATRAYAMDAKALVAATQTFVYGQQDVSTPLPAASAGTGAPTDPFQLARRFLARAGHLSGATEREGTALAGFLARPQGAPSFSSRTCVPTVTGADSLGNAIDADADGVPDDYKVDFGTTCSNSASGLVETYSGSFQYHDAEPGWGAYTFTATNLGYKLVDGSNGDNIKDIVNGTEQADFAALLASHAFDITYSRIGTFGGDQLSVTFDLVEDSHFVPDGGPGFSVGGTAPSGHLTLHLDYRAVGKGISADNVHFVITTVPSLHFQSGCGSQFSGGSLKGLLNGEASTGFALTWSGCGAPTVQLFGTTDGP